MIKEKDLPISVRYLFLLGSIILTFYLAIVLQSIIEPLIAAFIFAIILKPLCDIIERFKIPNIVSTFIAIFIMITVLVGLAYVVILQIKDINTDITGITESINSALDKIQSWISGKLGIDVQERENYIKNASNSLLTNSVSFLHSTLSITFNFVAEFFLFLIGVFFFLYYRNFLKLFLLKLTKPANHVHLENILQVTQRVIRKYLVGFFIVLVIVAALNTTGLLLLQIKHAFFFGILGSILLIIPYIGITIGASLPFLFALATTGSLLKPILVILIFWLVQILEGNFITPNIVGKQVSINPFAVLLFLFLSGKFFGLMGIILSIPVLAIIKVICDEIKPLKPIGFILGIPAYKVVDE